MIKMMRIRSMAVRVGACLYAYINSERRRHDCEACSLRAVSSTHCRRAVGG